MRKTQNKPVMPLKKYWQGQCMHCIGWSVFKAGLNDLRGIQGSERLMPSLLGERIEARILS